MVSDKRGYLRIPQGTEGFYLDEAYRHRMLTAEVERLFYQWGYLPAQTPVVDYYDVYAPLLSDDDTRSIYRLIDRDGDLLMLRSDVTLFLAKQMGMILRAEDLPIRVCYADTILRHQNREDISRNEFFQAGVELIGPQTIDADLEVVLLLRRTLEHIGAPGFFIHIGSRALFTAGFGQAPSSARRRLRRSIVLRDMQQFAAEAAEAGETAVRIEALQRLYSFIGPLDALEALCESLSPQLSAEESRCLQELTQLASILTEAEDSTPYRIDLSEIGSQPYHTGVAFRAYVDGLDASIAAGGRYDRLYGLFGFETPAVGFSLMLRKLQDDAELHARFQPPPSERAAGENFLQRLRDAEEKRRGGRSVTL